MGRMVDGMDFSLSAGPVADLSRSVLPLAASARLFLLWWCSTFEGILGAKTHFVDVCSNGGEKMGINK